MKFKHFLIVPFNASNKDSDWLNHRLQYFRAFTKPSILTQTSTNFTPIFLIDPETPENIQTELTNMGGLLYRTESMWAAQRDSEDEKDSEFSSFVREQCDQSHWVVTSRVDSDDAIAKNFIEVTQNLVREEEEFIIYPNGIMWAHKQYFEKDTKSPPFGTLVEPLSDYPKTVFSAFHGSIPRKYPCTSYPDERMWIHVYHGRNLATKANKLGPEVPVERMIKEFGVEEKWLT